MAARSIDAEVSWHRLAVEKENVRIEERERLSIMCFTNFNHLAAIHPQGNETSRNISKKIDDYLQDDDTGDVTGDKMQLWLRQGADEQRFISSCNKIEGT